MRISPNAVNWRTWGLYSLIVLASLLGAELLARIYDWGPRSRDFAAGDNLGMSRYNHSSGGFGDLVPGQDGHWATWFHRPYHVQTNSVGLRNTEEPSDKAFRILAVGDSQTFGPFLGNEDTWPAWTENYLRRRDQSDERIQVFNAGIVGYTIVEELAYLEDKAIAFKPQLVVLAVFENDLRDLAKEKGGVRKRPRHTSGFVDTLRTIGRNLALVHLGDQIKTGFKLKLAGVDTRGGIRGGTGWAPPSTDDTALAKRFTELFNDTVALLKSHGIGLAVIFIPAADCMDTRTPSVMEPVVRGATAASGTPYLDLTTTFRAQSDPVSRLYLLQRAASGRLVGDGHISREGGAVIGQAVANWLADAGLVDHRHAAISVRQPASK